MAVSSARSKRQLNVDSDAGRSLQLLLSLVFICADLSYPLTVAQDIADSILALASALEPLAEVIEDDSTMGTVLNGFLTPINTEYAHFPAPLIPPSADHCSPSPFAASPSPSEESPPSSPVFFSSSTRCEFFRRLQSASPPARADLNTLLPCSLAGESEAFATLDTLTITNLRSMGIGA